MQIEQESWSNIKILKLNGRLDASNTSEFKDFIMSLISNEEKRLLIDMKEVDFIDSSGLGVLVTCLRSATKIDGTLKISSLQKNPKTVFETTRLDRVFEIFEDRDEALKSFN